jgi:hypothetical protein
LCVAVSVLVGLLLVAPSASATTDAARLAAAGIDASVLAPGWSIVGDEIWWEDGQVRRSIGDTELACRAGYVCAYELTVRRPVSWVRLSVVRPWLEDVPPDVVDAELDRMIEEHDVHLEAALDQRSLTDDDWNAAVEIGGERRHQLKIGTA